MKKLCIFDLDGTLVDSLRDLADSTNLVLSINNFPTHPVEAYRHFVGDGAYQLVRRALPEDSREESVVLTCKGQFDVIYNERCFAHTRPYDGAKELLKHCREAGILTAVLSNKPHPFTKQIVERLFSPGDFDMVLGQQDGMPKKPDPAGVERILQALKTAPEDAVLIGDSDVDVITAKNAGICSVGVCWGFRGREELSRAGADFLAESMEECWERIRQA